MISECHHLIHYRMFQWKKIFDLKHLYKNETPYTLMFRPQNIFHIIFVCSNIISWENSLPSFHLTERLNWDALRSQSCSFYENTKTALGRGGEGTVSDMHLGAQGRQEQVRVHDSVKVTEQATQTSGHDWQVSRFSHGQLRASPGHHPACSTAVSDVPGKGTILINLAHTTL